MINLNNSGVVGGQVYRLADRIRIPKTTVLADDDFLFSPSFYSFGGKSYSVC